MVSLRLIFSSLIGMAFLFCGAVSETRADIFHYKDENGVWHFSNIKNDRRYKLYIRTDKVSLRNVTYYIRNYDGIIKQAAARYQVEESLIKAVIKTESDFDHRAVSCKGAQGLMQLMPGTADAMQVDDPFDPVSNIFGGTRYLGILLIRFKQDKKLALAAYNAGPETVEEYQGIPPFSETETFVKKVLNYYQQFMLGSK